MEIKKVVVVSENSSLNTDRYRPYVIQQPGLREGKKIRVAYDSLKTAQSCEDIAKALSNDGFLKATVRSLCHVKKHTRKKRNPKCEVVYFLHPSTPYYIDSICFA